VASSYLEVSATLVARTMTVVVPLTEEGAVYRPVELMEPSAGWIDQVTAVFVVPETVAVKACVWPGWRLAVFGLTLTETTEPLPGFTVRVALLVTPPAAAVILTDCCTATGYLWIVKYAQLEPAGTVTLGGTDATAGAELVRLTMTSRAG